MVDFISDVTVMRQEILLKDSSKDLNDTIAKFVLKDKVLVLAVRDHDVLDVVKVDGEFSNRHTSYP